MTGWQSCEKLTAGMVITLPPPKRTRLRKICDWFLLRDAPSPVALEVAETFGGGDMWEDM